MHSFLPYTMISGEVDSAALDYQLRDEELAALGIFGLYESLEDVEGFRDRFVDILEAPASVSPLTRQYLATEGLSYFDGIELDARHLLFWLDRVLKLNKIAIGYTNRLSEAGAGWGEAAPDNLTDADPLGLVAVLEALGCNVAIIDPEAVDDGDSGSTDGPVLITDSSRNCTRLEGTAKTTADLFATVSVARDTYRHKLWGIAGSGNDVAGGFGNLHEAGGSVHRFPNSTKPCIVLTRYGDDHQVARERIWRNPSLAAPAYIWIGGYPGEFPVVRFGSSVTGEDVDTVVNGPQIWIGFSGSLRSNTHLRNMSLIGNRDGTYLTGGSEVTGRVFAHTLIHVSGSTDCSIRYCSITGTLPILSTHPDAASFPQYVDIVSAARPAEVGNEAGYTPLRVFGQRFVYDRNYMKPADTDIPLDEYDGSGGTDSYPFSRGIDVQHSDCTVSYSTFEGVATGDYVRCTCRSAVPNITDWHVHHNVVTSNGYKCLLASAGYGESVAGTVEYNYIYDAGTDGQQTFGGSNVDFTGNGIIFRYNVVANNVDGQVQRDGLTAPGLHLNTLAFNPGGSFPNDYKANDISADAYGNIIYNARVEIGNGGAAAYGSAPGEAVNAVYDNIIHGVQIPEKQENSMSDRYDSPTKVVSPVAVGLGSSRYTNNNVTRDSGDDNAAVIFLHEKESAVRVKYGYSEAFAGVTGTTQLDPQFADPANGDFTVGNATLAALVAPTPKTRAAVGAWTPPE